MIKRLCLLATVLSCTTAFAQDVDCNSLGVAVAYMAKADVSNQEKISLVQACQTGIQMREDGISGVKYTKFIRTHVMNDSDFTPVMRKLLAQSMTYGYEGNVEGSKVVMGEDIRNK